MEKVTKLTTIQELYELVDLGNVTHVSNQLHQWLGGMALMKAVNSQHVKALDFPTTYIEILLDTDPEIDFPTGV